MKKLILSIILTLLLAGSSFASPVFGPYDAPYSTTLPGTCTIGQIFLDTDAGGGAVGILYFCNPANTWVIVGGTGVFDPASPGPIGGTTPAAGTFTTLTAISTNSLTLGTDSAGSVPAIGSIIFHNATNTNHFSLISGTTGAALSWTLPIAAPAGNNYLLNAQTTGVLGYTDPATFATAANWGGSAAAPPAIGSTTPAAGTFSPLQAKGPAIVTTFAGTISRAATTLTLMGKKPTEETLKKMSEARKGEKNGMFGRKHTQESIKKIIETKKRKGPYPIDLLDLMEMQK